MQLFDGTPKSLDSLGAVKDQISAVSVFVLGIAGALAVIFIIIGGIQLAISAGNPQGQEKAKKTITNAIVGLVLAICAGAIGQFILAAFGS